MIFHNASKPTLWQPTLITSTSFLYGLFLVSLGTTEIFAHKTILFTVTTIWLGFISILSSIGAHIGLITKDYLTLTSCIVLLTLENLFILFTCILSLFDVVYNYRIYTKHNAYYLFVLLEDYKWLGMVLFTTLSFLSLFSLLYMWTFYETIGDEDVANLLGHPFNMTSDFWHYPTSRTAASKLFTPRKPIHKLPYNSPNNNNNNNNSEHVESMLSNPEFV